MPQFGSGIVPAAGAVAQELSNTVRRGFLESVIIQIYQADPMIAALLETAQLASGGLSPITANLQGNPMVTSQWVGPDGSFDQPGVTPGITNAEFNLKAIVTAIPFLGFEGLIQVDYATVPLIEARVNDATNETIDSLSNALYQNVSNQIQLIGLQGAIDDGTFSASYGGITRSTSTWWKSTYVHNGGATTPTRNLLMQYVAQVTKKNGEMPKMGLCGVGTWTLLTQDFMPLERYNRSPTGSPVGEDAEGAKSGFEAVMVGKVPIYCSPKCPEGVLWLINTDYLSMYIHEKAGFQFTGFESTFAAANQFGYLGALLTLLELVSVKAQCHGKFDGLAFLNI
jgi:hypothetical protein